MVVPLDVLQVRCTLTAVRPGVAFIRRIFLIPSLLRFSVGWRFNRGGMHMRVLTKWIICMRTCCTAITRPDHWPVSLYVSFSKLHREHQRCHKNRRRTSEEKKRKSKERLTKQGVTHRTNSVVWLSLYACAQPYYPGRYQVTVDSCFDLVWPHQHGITDNRKYRLCRDEA